MASIYTDQEPTGQFNGGSSRTLAAEFETADDRTVTHVRFWGVAPLPSNVTAGIWQGPNWLATQSSTGPFVAGDWNDIELPIPVAIDAETVYGCAVWKDDGEWPTATLPPQNVSNDGMTLVSHIFRNTNTGPPSSDPPATDSAADAFFVDIEAQAASPHSVSDNFDRADENPLSPPWQTVAGMAPLEIVNQEAVGTSGTDNGMFWMEAVGQFSNNQFAQVTLTGGGDDGGPAVRVSEGSDTMYTTWITGGERYITKHLSGATSTLGDPVASGGDLVAGDVLRLEANGNQISLYANDTLLGTRADSDIAGGHPGIYTWSNEVTWDDWSGGGLATDAEVQPGTGHVHLAGRSPALQMGRSVAPSAAALRPAGRTPMVRTGTTVRPRPGHARVAGLAPTLRLRAPVEQVSAGPAAALRLAGQPPMLQTVAEVVVAARGPVTVRTTSRPMGVRSTTRRVTVR